MAAEDIGELVPTKIPGYADAADIQAALRLYHYGSYTFDVNETNAANLINPSLAYSINDLQNQIDNVDLTAAIQKTDLNAKGDILSASADNTLSVLSVGTNGQVLTANSATSSGLQWSTPEVSISNSVTLTNKTLSLGSNTLTGTTAQFNTALTDGDFATLAGSETLTNKTLTAPIINVAFNSQSGTTYTIVLADNGKVVEVTNSLPITVSIPTNTTAFPIGAQITVTQTGSGQITFAAVTPGTTTVNGSPGLKLRGQWSSAVLLKRDTEKWIVIGDTVA